jgi:CRP-like cAMP-binding protein
MEEAELRASVGDLPGEDPSRADCCQAGNLALFSVLKKRELAGLAEPIELLNLRKRDVLYEPGVPATHVFALHRGIVKLVHYARDGSERIVRLLRRGDVAGLESLVGHAHQHHAVALDPVVACRIPAGIVNQLGRELPHFRQELMRHWHLAVVSADILLTQLATGLTRERIARLLIHLAESEPDHTCRIPSRTEIASMLGVTTESISRNMAQFRRDGMIRSFERKRVQVDIHALRAVAF